MEMKTEGLLAAGGGSRVPDWAAATPEERAGSPPEPMSWRAGCGGTPKHGPAQWPRQAHWERGDTAGGSPVSQELTWSVKRGEQGGKLRHTARYALRPTVLPTAQEGRDVEILGIE